MQVLLTQIGFPKLSGRDKVTVYDLVKNKKKISIILIISWGYTRFKNMTSKTYKKGENNIEFNSGIKLKLLLT